jgi:hypothetical protein
MISTIYAAPRLAHITAQRRRGPQPRRQRVHHRDTEDHRGKGIKHIKKRRIYRRDRREKAEFIRIVKATIRHSRADGNPS